MNRQQLFSTGIVCLLFLCIILTYNSWEYFVGSLVIWAALLTFEIFILVIYVVDWVINEIDNNGK